ncbi:MAG TPA: YIP1 family protein [Verrucomicrobiae bacterium]|nr:YIP1 family protein [Verrucomicrobiae bacterium]
MEQPPPILDPQPETALPTMSLWARLFNVLATPGEVFQQIRTSRVSNANWLVPGIILILVSWIGAWVVFSQDSIQQQLREITDQAIEKQIEKGKLSEQQAEQARAAAAKFGTLGPKIGAIVAPVWVGLVIPFWWGLILWFIGSKPLKGSLSYMKAVEIAGLSSMVSTLDSILRALMILITGSLFASPSLVMFVKQFDPQNPVHGLLTAFNIITFWVLLVRAIGVARVTQSSFAKAAVWVFGIWVFSTALFAGLGLAVQRIFSR